MRRHRWIGIPVIIAVAIVSAAGMAGATNDEGAHLYRMQCASCHGPRGQGDGPDATIFVVRPRDLREGLLKKYTPDELVRWVRDGRALELVLDPPALRARAADVEDLIAYLTRFPMINWQLAEVGRALYVDRCEQCHGVTASPSVPLPAGVKPPRELPDPAFQRSLSDAELVAVVCHGRQGMPGLTPRIPASDGPALAAFVRLFSPGFRLYTRDCASCHGDDGRGVAIFGSPIRLPTIKFDRQYFTAHDAEYLRTKVWHMLAEHRPTMPHYRATLSEDEARAIVEYLQRITDRRAH